MQSHVEFFGVMLTSLLDETGTLCTLRFAHRRADWSPPPCLAVWQERDGLDRIHKARFRRVEHVQLQVYARHIVFPRRQSLPCSQSWTLPHPPSPP